MYASRPCKCAKQCQQITSIHATSNAIAVPCPFSNIQAHDRRHMRHYSGPAQQRYGSYFGRVLHDQRLTQPSMLSKQLHQIVFSSLKGLNVAAADSAAAIDASISAAFFDEDVTPFLVVFQHGRSVFSVFAEPQVGITKQVEAQSHPLKMLFHTSSAIRQGTTASVRLVAVEVVAEVWCRMQC